MKKNEKNEIIQNSTFKGNNSKESLISNIIR